MLNIKLISLLEEYSPIKSELKEEMSLYHDLNISGDDADEFLHKYSEAFNVSISNLDFADYFPSEGDPIFPAIIRFITGRKNREYKRLTIKNLQEAIEAKVLK